MRWSRRRRALLRATLAVLIAVAALVLPLPGWTPNWVVWVHVPLVVFTFICYLGKLLYDTLFYPRAPW
jgi:hypothetical protein